MGDGWINPSNVGSEYNSSQPSWFGMGQTPLNNVLPILSGITGAVPQSGTQTTDGTSALQTLQNLFGSSSSNIAGSGSSNTNTTTGYGSGGNQVISQSLPVLSNLLKGTDLTKSFLPQQITNINAAAGAQQTGADTSLAARGLSTSPVAGTVANNINSNRLNQITNVQQQLPLLQQQMQGNALGSAGSFLSELPRNSSTGSTQAQNQQANGITSQSGNSNQTGSQSSTTNTKSGGGVGGFLGGLAGTLASLFA